METGMGVRQAVEKTVEWTKAWQSGENINLIMKKQIRSFLDQMK